MATTKFFLDCRRVADGVSAPLKIAVRNRDTSAFIPTGVSLLPSQWDSVTARVINHPQRQPLNARLARRKGEIDVALLALADECDISRLTATALKRRILSITAPDTVAADSDLFAARFLRFAQGKTGRTAEIYLATLSRMRSFAGVGLDTLRFEDITRTWLEGFDAFLSHTSPSRNARNIHLRNIRAVFNDAIDNEVTVAYPFRRFKIKPEPTRKRSMSVEALRGVLTADVPGWAVKYRDFFALSFMLIGINVKDLCMLGTMIDGRVEFRRAKTHKPYSIKVEPEALALIERYRGEERLLSFMDGYADYRHFYNRLCKGLAVVRDACGLLELTTYWARHSWATIAAAMDIPKETIAAALGHGGNSVTDIYIDFDQRKVDEANRRVLDLVLYGKM